MIFAAMASAEKEKTMSCQYKDECPSYSGWCEGPKGDFSRCIPFIINAVKGARQENVTLRQQLDKVKKQAGLWKRRFKMEEKANEISIEELLNVTAERDAALNDLRGKCSVCVHYTPNHHGVICLTCGWEHRPAAFLSNDFWASDCWQWRGPTEGGWRE